MAKYQNPKFNKERYAEQREMKAAGVKIITADKLPPKVIQEGGPAITTAKQPGNKAIRKNTKRARKVQGV